MADERPLSPHLQIYKPQLTSVLSITHRVSGIFLCVGTLVLAYWLFALASGPEEYATAQNCLSSLIAQVFLFLWTLAFFYHLLNGIRHLIWDMGKGFELDVVYASGRWVVAGTVILTLLAWVIARVL